jgi:phosphonatase-like hydrolase
LGYPLLARRANEEKTMIELVVFDMAGTTVYDGDAVNTSFRSALNAACVHAEAEAVNAVMGLHKPEAIRHLLADAGRTFTEQEVNAIHNDFVQRMSTYYATDPAVREVSGAAAAFTALRRAGIKTTLNTGFNRAVTDVILHRLGWRSSALIDAVVTSDEVPRGRPHPDMIQLLMSRLDVRDPRQVAKVGDTKADLEEGTNAGCGLVIGVTSGTCTREQLQALPHSHIVESVAEVPALIATFNRQPV